MRASTPPPPSRTPSAASAALGSGVLTGVLLVLVAVEWAPLIALDRAVAETLHESAVRSPGLTRANRVLTDWVWDPWTMRALLAVTALWLWWRRERTAALWVAGAGVVGAAVQQALKAAVGRERPDWPDPVDSAHFAAFPSGHAMTAVVAFGLLLWLLARYGADRRGWWAVAVIGAVSVLGVGLTRVYLGVHWATDVLGGWLLGVCVVAVAVLTYERRAVPRGSAAQEAGRSGR
ncbi:phosphatase PAP2 family protein [Streptomyces sp. NPDC050856]|uniref:phosphatase PAP2 family protein n=1 Tax=Streptomyces sp. NPDC050856 TaxID=3154939 RepID=UPI0033CBCACB